MLSKIFRLLMTIAFLILTSSAWAQNSGEGRLVTTSGEVYINGQPAKAGDIVPPGAKIETAPGATASVIFGNDSVVNFSSSSVVTVDAIAGSAVTVSVLKGAVDGVKKMGTSSVEAIVVKTDSATFTLNSGRYVVGRNESSSNPAMSYVTVDGDAVITYTKDTRSGQKAGDSVTLGAGSFVTVRPSQNSSSSVTSNTQKMTESQSNELRPSQQQTSSAQDTAQGLSQAIVNPETPLSTNTSRLPASTTNTNSSETTPGFSGSGNTTLQPGGGVVRDPLQPLPGQTNPNVQVIFEP